MERYCSTGQSPEWAVAPTEEEEFKDFKYLAITSSIKHNLL